MQPPGAAGWGYLLCVHGHRPAAEVIPMAMAVKASVQCSAGDDMKMLQVNTLTQLGK